MIPDRAESDWTGITWTGIAATAYAAYRASLGESGEESPWEGLSPRIRTAWEAAIRQASSPTGDPGRWRGWTPPAPTPKPG